MGRGELSSFDMDALEVLQNVQPRALRRSEWELFFGRGSLDETIQRLQKAGYVVGGSKGYRITGPGTQALE